METCATDSCIWKNAHNQFCLWVSCLILGTGKGTPIVRCGCLMPKDAYVTAFSNSGSVAIGAIMGMWNALGRAWPDFTPVEVPGPMMAATPFSIKTQAKFHRKYCSFIKTIPVRVEVIKKARWKLELKRKYMGSRMKKHVLLGKVSIAPNALY